MGLGFAVKDGIREEARGLPVGDFDLAEGVGAVAGSAERDHTSISLKLLIGS